MSKYENKTERVIVVGGNKFLIPGAEAVELTADEELSSTIKEYIEAGYLAKVAEVVVDIPADPLVANESEKPKK